MILAGVVSEHDGGGSAAVPNRSSGAWRSDHPSRRVDHQGSQEAPPAAGHVLGGSGHAGHRRVGGQCGRARRPSCIEKPGVSPPSPTRQADSDGCALPGRGPAGRRRQRPLRNGPDVRGDWLPEREQNVMHVARLSPCRGPRGPRESRDHRPPDTQRVRGWPCTRSDCTPNGHPRAQAVCLGNDRWRSNPFRSENVVPLLFVVSGHAAWFVTVRPSGVLGRR